MEFPMSSRGCFSMKTVLSACAAIALFCNFAMGLTRKAGLPSGQDGYAAIRKVVESYFSSYSRGNIEEIMSYWDPTSAGAIQQRKILTEVFEKFGGFSIKGGTIDNITSSEQM